MMRRILFILAMTGLAAACTTPAPNDGAPVVMREASGSGAQSIASGCDRLVPIYAETTRDGLARENAWIEQRYPGAVKTGQQTTRCGDAMVDVIRIRTAQGREETVWFDITSFFGQTGGGDIDSMLDG